MLWRIFVFLRPVSRGVWRVDLCIVVVYCTFAIQTTSILTFAARKVVLDLFIANPASNSVPSIITDGMPDSGLLHTGRRRVRMDGKYNGPARQGPVRHISPVTLNLERIYTQNRLNMQKRDGKVPEPAPGPAAKGKPRLLLMGQRR